MSSYRIRSGDTLSALARRFHTSVSALAKANGIKNPNLIYAGATLQIPGGSDHFVPSKPGKGRGSTASAGPVGVTATGKPPASFQEGAWGGQCLAWVNKTSGRPMWNYCAKDCLTNHPGWNRTNTPKPGDLFVMANGQYGHIGYVLGVNKNGTVTVADSNWNLDEREHVHQIPMSEIAAYLSPA